MFVSNGILALLTLAAGPSADADLSSAQAAVVQTPTDNADTILVRSQQRFTAMDWDSAATAQAGDAERLVGYASPAEDGLFPDIEIPPPEMELLPPEPLPPKPSEGDDSGQQPELLPESIQPMDEAIKYYEEDVCSELGGCDADCLCTECRSSGGRCERVGVRIPLRIDGWISQGLTFNGNNPPDHSNFPVTFNDRANNYQMNQLYVILENAVDRCGCRWDVGGRVDLLYGTDSIYTTSRGLETHGDGTARWNSERYGLAMPQAYMEVYTPWMDGVTVKLGHFYTILGYETVPAAENFFYSKSYAMQYAEPFTHTGLLGTTRVGELAVHAGMTRGWDNWEDNNNDLAFLGGIDWTSADEGTSIALAMHCGRERDEPPAHSEHRNVYSLVLQQWITQRLLYAVQYDHGFDEHAAADGRHGDFFGVNQYLYYTIDRCLRAGIRYEWFCDEDGTRIESGVSADYYAVSMGLNWTPTDWITVRPEMRWDWAKAIGETTLSPDRDGTQVLVALDVVIRL